MSTGIDVTVLLAFICKGKSTRSKIMSGAFLHLINVQLLPRGLDIMSFKNALSLPYLFAH